MREIKFRGKSIETGEWVYGYYVYTHDRHRIIYEDYEGFYCEEEVDPETVGQYINLKDKAGREIYEGDILNLKTRKHNGSFFDLEIETIYKQSVIEWWQSHSNIGYRLRDAKGKTMMIKPSSLNTMEAEVIGNIYDNPELLGVR